MKHSWLPGVLAELAEEIGIEPTLRLAEAVGGTRIHIPARCGARHWLSKLLGHAEAQKVCAHFRTLDPDGRELGAENIILPRGPTSSAAKVRRRIAQELDKGVSPRKAARIAGATERTAWRVKARRRAPAKTSQGELF